MNAALELLPPLPVVRSLDDVRVARAEAASAAFLDRLDRDRRDEARRRSMRLVRVPGDVFEDIEFYLVG